MGPISSAVSVSIEGLTRASGDFERGARNLSAAVSAPAKEDPVSISDKAKEAYLAHRGPDVSEALVEMRMASSNVAVNAQALKVAKETDDTVLGLIK